MRRSNWCLTKDNSDCKSCGKSSPIMSAHKLHWQLRWVNDFFDLLHFPDQMSGGHLSKQTWHCQRRATDDSEVHVKETCMLQASWYQIQVALIFKFWYVVKSIQCSCSVSQADDLQSYLPLHYVLLLLAERWYQHWVFACARFNALAKYITLLRQSIYWSGTLTTHEMLQLEKFTWTRCAGVRALSRVCATWIIMPLYLLADDH